MTESHVLLREVRGRTLLLTLNRPAVKNALSAELLRELTRAIRTAGEQDGLRAVVLQGAGGAFCAGLDIAALREMAGLTPEEQRQDSQGLSTLLLAITHCPLPVIAAVEGPAVGAGAGIAAACDLVVAGQGARLGYTEVRLGFVPAIVAAYALRALGDKHARELLLEARIVAAEEAWRLGLVNEVCPDGGALEAALARAARLARNSPTALATTKELLGVLGHLSLEDGLRYAVAANAWTRTTRDMHEGVAAFLEKRPPTWQEE